MPSSLISLPGQPIMFSEPSSDSCGCNQPTQCVLAVPNQQLYSQFKLQPCGTVNVCNNTLGAELIQNGDFATDLANWTAGAGWTWSAGAACNDGSPNALDQTIAAGLVNGAAYLLVVETKNYTSGDITVLLGGTLSTIDISDDGTYSEVLISGAGTDIRFDSNPDFLGCIDNISLKLITSCWDADETDWITSVDGACHVIGNTADITNTGTTLTVGLYYHITFTVTGTTAGGVTLRASSAFGGETIGNGTFDRWGTADGAAAFFRPSSDFDGCISTLEVVQYNLNSVYHLLTSDGDFVADISANFNVIEDVVYLDVFNINNVVGDDYGCYKICMVDGCYGDLAQFDANLIENGDFSAGSDHWTSNNATFVGGAVTIGPGADSWIQQPLKTTGEIDCIRIQFHYSNEASGGNVIIYIDGVNSDSEIINGVGNVDRIIQGPIPAGATIRIENVGAPLAYELDNVVISVPESCRVYSQCSTCIKYGASFGCTKMVEGYSAGRAFNFLFDDPGSGNNIFKLSLRAKCELLHSTFPQEQDDYTFSTGSSSINYAESTEFESLVFHPIPKFKHRAIALIKVCDTIQLDSINYFCKKGDYVPEWNKNTNTDLAPSRIDVKIKDQTLFNTNCG